jgi:membrane-associated phospholipid phosphatase
MGAAMTNALPSAGAYAQRAGAFLLRHRWSVPLSVASSATFVYLGAEMRDGSLDGVDAAIAGVVHGWRGSMDGLMLFFTRTGGGRGMTCVCIAVLLALLIARRLRTALFMGLAGLGTLLLISALKLLFHRARPDVVYLIDTPSSFSFPSGHAMGSMGIMASVLVVVYAVGTPHPLRRIATLLIGLYVVGVALSRVYFGVHYPSDVIGGQLGAAAWVSALTGWFYPRLFPGEETVEPAPSP